MMLEVTKSIILAAWFAALGSIALRLEFPALEKMKIFIILFLMGTGFIMSQGEEAQPWT